MSSLTAERTRPRALRLAALALAAVAVAAVLVAAGRWEGRRAAAAQVRGMERVRALVGPLDSPTLSGFRVLSGFDCLVYRRGSNPYALELCVDAQGRVVEAIDRRQFDRKIYDLHYDPAASTLRLDRAEVDRLLHRMGAPGL